MGYNLRGRRRRICRTDEVRDGSCQLVAERQREGRGLDAKEGEIPTRERDIECCVDAMLRPRVVLLGDADADAVIWMD